MARIGLVLAIFILVISSFALAESCTSDEDCSDLGDTWTCDTTDTLECVELDVEGITSSEDDSTDSDGDGTIDSEDSEEDDDSCIDGYDNDGDGLVDCLDDSCDYYSYCEYSVEYTCDDGYDNDVDELIDEEDSDCLDADDNGIVDGLELSSSDDDTSESEDSYEDTTEIAAALSALEESVSDLEASIEEISSEVDTLENSVADVETDIQLLGTEQYQLERDVEEQVNTIESQVSTGLAVLQEEIDTTQTELEGTQEEVESSVERASFFRTLSIVFVLLVIFGAIGFFLRTHKIEEEKTIPKNVRNFITKQIKSGVPEGHIILALEKSGWPTHDAKWAFEQTTVHNYNDFLDAHGKTKKAVPKHKPSSEHYQKIAIVSILSIVILAALVFFVKQSVGFAVYYEGISSDELSDLALETLDLMIEQNSFYETIDYVDICLQITDDDAVASFRVLKTPYGHSIEEIDVHCVSNPEEYDFAVSFTSWNTFSSLVGSLTCTGIESAHAIEEGSIMSRGMYVLPSYYVASGFDIVEGVDYSDFCGALSLCLSDSDLALIGIEC